MAKAICLYRHDDASGVSGTGRIWEGVIFSNGWIAGKWISEFPSYGWYPSLEHLLEIHGHSGKTELVYEDLYPYALSGISGGYITIESHETSDGITWVAEGFEFSDGWIVLLQLAKHTSVYWYRNIEDLQRVIGRRSHITRDTKPIEFGENHAVWEREKIFKLTQKGIENK